ncbi:hypothetical protein F5876DRAFT_38639 [Lentinula aff. lateritia]|uniref:Uncharacterized protein n=1 Tax=Lentinula aff. lateritia TaxID=2804960 RepID=A0ACC1U5K0_9AGAR|nr:hypothetical protein F5876DRAFT_38639 [Lentinula aff. lateritia]
MFVQASFVAFLCGSAYAGTTIWSGSFNPYPTVSTFDDWSWADEVGTYQWYIHGTEPTSHYLALDPSYKNPADTAEVNGLMVTIDSTAEWNSDMERTELIPQTTQNLGTGNLFYHFSLSTDPTGLNAPDSTLEHQILFFESHFTEIKYGVAPNPTDLQWMVSSQFQWGTPLVPGTWYNFAYDIDFTGSTVGLWFSDGSSPLTKVANNVAASTSTNSEDFHVGVLRIVNTPAPENWYISGVYIENGPITTAIGSGNSTGSSSSSSISSSSATSVTSTPTTTISSPSSTPTATAPEYGQCGGTGYTGPTTCASPFTCTAISPPYYYQVRNCLQRESYWSLNLSLVSVIPYIELLYETNPP